MDIKLSRSLKFLNTIVEKIVFESRWLLILFNLGLILALFRYMLRFAADCYIFLRMHNADSEQVMVAILGLVDSYMIANLLIMIIKGSYQIFIHKFNVTAENRPGWLDHIDTGLLKVKTMQSVASISGIELLKDFVDVEHLDWLVVQHQMLLHALFLLSATMMAIIWRIIHTEDKHELKNEIRHNDPGLPDDNHHDPLHRM